MTLPSKPVKSVVEPIVIPVSNDSQKSVVKSSNALTWGLLILFVIVALAVFSFWVDSITANNNQPPAIFTHRVQDPTISSTVWFVSKQQDIPVFTQAWRSSPKTVIALSLVERGGANSGMAQALTLFQTVFRSVSEIPDHNIITLTRLYNGTTLLSCQTNLGDSKTLIDWTPEQCLTFLQQNDQFVIDIPFPDATISTNLIDFENNYVYLRTKTNAEIGSTAYAFVQGLYPESKSVLATINDRIDVINRR